ncbi:MAG TPA: 4a-hydroxytetrahydrobiopterin dehydratase [Dongiaceae bacterium]|nr:4a-hydroxytetrahydrobiopterin dehydratase [Dongiaceae bacterium]
MTRLSDDEVRAALAEGLTGWDLEGDGITKEFAFSGFRPAIDFIDRVAERAQAARHHPELHNVFNRVTVTLTTHDEGGVTEKDIDLARAIEAVADLEV